MVSALPFFTAGTQYKQKASHFNNKSKQHYETFEGSLTLPHLVVKSIPVYTYLTEKYKKVG